MPPDQPRHSIRHPQVSDLTTLDHAARGAGVAESAEVSHRLGIAAGEVATDVIPAECPRRRVVAGVRPDRSRRMPAEVDWCSFPTGALCDAEREQRRSHPPATLDGAHARRL